MCLFYKCTPVTYTVSPTRYTTTPLFTEVLDFPGPYCFQIKNEYSVQVVPKPPFSVPPQRRVSESR